MQALILLAIISSLSFEFLAGHGWLPNKLVFTPEILAMLAATITVVTGVRSRFRCVSPVYILVFGALALIVLCGLIVNHMASGPIFAGIRTYLWALPFFFLPAVVEIKERQIQVQLLVLLGFAVAQLPIAAEQQLTRPAGDPGGDTTYGTLMGSGLLTVFLVCAACVLTGFFIRKRISAAIYVPLILILLLPTMLNETKSTLVLVPIALFGCFVTGAKPGQRLRNTVVGVIVATCFIAVFIPVYDHVVGKPRWGYGIVEFITREGRVENYLDSGAEVGQYEKSPGKMGGMKIALSEVSRDPVSLVFGFGIGNVSDSSLGHRFVGKHFRLYEVFLSSSAILFVFEIGLAGLALVLLLYWFIFKDSLSAARDDQGVIGAMAIGWSGVVLTIFLSSFLSNLLDSRAISLLFWYFSGVLAAHRMRDAIGAAANRKSTFAPQYTV